MDVWALSYPDFYSVTRPDGSRTTVPKRPYHGNDRLVWPIGPDYKTNKEWQYVWDLFLHKGRKSVPIPYKILQKANSPQQGNLRLLIEWGIGIDGEPVRTLIEGKSATNPESLQGEQVDVANLSEAAEYDRKIWERYLATRTGQAIWPTTPKLSAEWIQEQIQMGADDPSLGIRAFAFDGHANPIYDWELYRIEERKAASRTPTGIAEDDPWFAEQFMGRWVMAAEQAVPFVPAPTRIHPGHVLRDRPAWLSFARWFVSCDYGYDDAAVALFHAIGPDQVVVAAEIYERKLPAKEFVDKIRETAKALRLQLEYVVGDPKKPEVAHHMRQLGLPVWDRSDKRMIADRASGFLNLIDLLSLNERGEPGLAFLSEECGEGLGVPKTIRELKTLRRRSDFHGDQWSEGAFRGDDHAFDALRYGMQTRPKGMGLAREVRSEQFMAALRRARAEAQRNPAMDRPIIGHAAHLSLRAVA